MQVPQQGAPVIFRHQPMFSIRYTYTGQKDLYHSYCIPQVHVKNNRTGNLVRREFGAKGLAMGHWNDLVQNGVSHLNEQIVKAELLYGGDLVSGETVIVGAQVLRSWTPAEGEVILLDAPEITNYIADEESETAVDVTIDPTASSLVPTVAEDQTHVPEPNAPRFSVGAVNGSPHMPTVEIPVQETGSSLSLTVQTPDDPSVHVEVESDAPALPLVPTVAEEDPIVVTAEATTEEAAN